MITDQTVIVGVAPRISKAKFVKILRDAGSPAAGTGAEAHDALASIDIDPLAALAIFFAESQLATDPNAIVLTHNTHNPGNTRSSRTGSYPIVQTARGPFVKFPDWVSGWADFYRLVDPTYVYVKEGRKTIRQIAERWAPPSDNNDSQAYINTVIARMNGWGDEAPEEETPPMAGAKIIIVAGHRSHGDHGNPEEKSLTPAMALAYVSALRAAGHEVHYLQQEDQDSDPDDVVGGLDTVGQKTAAMADRLSGDNLVMLDLHYEGGGAGGMFAIIPDVTGLRTAVAGGAPSGDTWEANVLDRKLGRAIVDQITAATGLRKRAGIREPGLMDEGQTGVGGQGFRLAMFAYTARHQARMTRLVIEHGALDKQEDRAIIFQPDFTNKCAAAAVRAVNAVYGAPGGQPTVPPPPPIPTPPPPTVPPPPAGIEYPEGIDLALAKKWHGKVTKAGKTFAFDPADPFSLAWLTLGAFPRITGVETYDTREYRRYAGGQVLWRANPNAPVKVLGE